MTTNAACGSSIVSDMWEPFSCRRALLQRAVQRSSLRSHPKNLKDRRWLAAHRIEYDPSSILPCPRNSAVDRAPAAAKKDFGPLEWKVAAQHACPAKA